MPTLKRRKDERPKRVFKKNKALYQSARWHAYSLSYRKIHRLCVMCLQEGITKVSECVDHKVPIEEGGAIWDADNHQALCFKHHNQKTKRENSNYGKESE